MSQSPPELTISTDRRDAQPRRGVVIVVREAARLLVIRRSQWVVAPGAHCFPGGHIEAGETDEEALVREFREELGGAVVPMDRLWESISPRGVHLTWWLAALGETGESLAPNPAEVESAFWCSRSEMAELPDLLDSNRSFLEAIARGQIPWAGDEPG